MTALPDLLAPHSDPRDSAHWNEWLTIKPRTRADAISLLHPPVRPGIQARAIMALVLGDAADLPFSWPEAPGISVGRIIRFERLSQPLLVYTLDVVRVALARLETESDIHLVGTYQHYLRELMARLPAGPDRLRALDLYDLRTPMITDPYSSPGPYEPYEELMTHPDIDTAIKAEADARMRRIIQAELSGVIWPRAAHETALPAYSTIIGRLLGSAHHLPYAEPVLREQVRFLLDLYRPGAFHLFYTGEFLAALGYLADAGLCRRLILALTHGELGCEDCSCGRLDARTDAGLSAAWELRLACGDDKIVASALDALIQDGQAYARKLDSLRLRQIKQAAADRAALDNFMQ